MSEIPTEQIECIVEFTNESRDMIEQLEPSIIGLSERCKKYNCWEVIGCDNPACERHGKIYEKPCWLDTGKIEGGNGVCSYSKSSQECISCKVFQLINGDGQVINSIFRLFHSIKGTAGYLDLPHVVNVSHAAENLLDLIRSGKIQLQVGHINLLCMACDFLKNAFDYIEINLNDKEMADQAETIKFSLKETISLATSMYEDDEKNRPDISAEITFDMIEVFVQEGDELLNIIEQDLLEWSNSPDDMKQVDGLFRHIHTFKGSCGFMRFSDMEQLSHRMESVLDRVRSGACVDNKRLIDNFLQFVNLLKSIVTDISQGGKGKLESINNYTTQLNSLTEKDDGEKNKKENPHFPLGEILVNEGVATSEDVELASEIQNRRIGEILVDMGAAKAEHIENALAKQQVLRGKTEPVKVIKSSSTAKKIVSRQNIRVDLEKLDSLVNQIGELVIAENMVINSPDLKGLKLETFKKSSVHMSKIIRDLQKTTMSLRMITVSGLFRRMIRLVHDLSGKFDKKVKLQLTGEETEVDKTVIENITDPLVHIVRNALDHGMESAAERKKLGKPETGTVNLSAMHKNNEIVIAIEDDGKGLDREKILKKASEKGLVTEEDVNLSDESVFDLIFNPGFTTRDIVTDTSGRGVGMDVVKKNLEKINGRVEIQSTPGKGSKFIMHIPLTLAIIDGMLVQAGNSEYILPIPAIRESFRPDSKFIILSPDGNELVRVRDKFLPVMRLHNLTKRDTKQINLCEGIMVVVEHSGKSICLFVDEILGQLQTVIKGLSDYVGDISGVSGCTILENGKVSLILDPNSLVEMGGN